MTRRPRILAGLALGLALIVVAGSWGWTRRLINPAPERTIRSGATSNAAPAGEEESPELQLADDLNAPQANIREDLARVAAMLAAYRSIYRSGNPVGDNRDIVKSLLGGNPHKMRFLRTEHAAINAQGELCDRWGTPFFFHAESGTRMEIRSAGPDRRLWTPDDVAITP